MTKIITKLRSINLPMWGSALAALAGVLGMILTPLLGPAKTGTVQHIIMVVSGVLIAIPTWHLGSVAAANSKLKFQLGLTSSKDVPSR